MERLLLSGIRGLLRVVGALTVLEASSAYEETESKIAADGGRYFSAPVVTKVASREGFRPE
jgi:hypothetical protein